MDTLNFNLVPHSAPIPFHNEDNHGRIIDHLDLLAPHETFAQLHAQGPAVFAATVLGRKAEYLETFWQGALQSQTPGCFSTLVWLMPPTGDGQSLFFFMRTKQKHSTGKKFIYSRGPHLQLEILGHASTSSES